MRNGESAALQCSPNGEDDTAKEYTVSSADSLAKHEGQDGAEEAALSSGLDGSVALVNEGRYDFINGNPSSVSCDLC